LFSSYTKAKSRILFLNYLWQHKSSFFRSMVKDYKMMKFR
jgi:hypothetical protein